MRSSQRLPHPTACGPTITAPNFMGEVDLPQFVEVAPVRFAISLQLLRPKLRIIASPATAVSPASGSSAFVSKLVLQSQFLGLNLRFSPQCTQTFLFHG